MTLRTDVFDLRGLRLRPGEARRLRLGVGSEQLTLGGERYAIRPALLAATLDVSRMTGGGYALRLRFSATVEGACTRCLEPAAVDFALDVREVSQPGGDPSLADQLESPYVQGEEVDLHAWARDALALALPLRLLCRDGCAGLCAVCGVNLNLTGSSHSHDAPPDPRWAKLSELTFE